jgi:hypothetical protein
VAYADAPALCQSVGLSIANLTQADLPGVEQLVATCFGTTRSDAFFGQYAALPTFLDECMILGGQGGTVYANGTACAILRVVVCQVPLGDIVTTVITQGNFTTTTTMSVTQTQTVDATTITATSYRFSPVISTSTTLTNATQESTIQQTTTVCATRTRVLYDQCSCLDSPSCDCRPNGSFGYKRVDNRAPKKTPPQPPANYNSNVVNYNGNVVNYNGNVANHSNNAINHKNDVIMGRQGVPYVPARNNKNQAPMTTTATKTGHDNGNCIQGEKRGDIDSGWTVCTTTTFAGYALVGNPTVTAGDSPQAACAAVGMQFGNLTNELFPNLDPLVAACDNVTQLALFDYFYGYQPLLGLFGRGFLLFIDESAYVPPFTGIQWVLCRQGPDFATTSTVPTGPFLSTTLTRITTIPQSTVTSYQTETETETDDYLTLSDTITVYVPTSTATTLTLTQTTQTVITTEVETSGCCCPAVMCDTVPVCPSCPLSTMCH